MKKKIVGLMLAGVAVFALSGCDGSDDYYESPIPETYFITNGHGHGVADIIYHCDSGFSGVTNFEGAFTFDIVGDNCNFDFDTHGIVANVYIEYDNDPYTDAGINGIYYECVTYGALTETGETGPYGFITDASLHQGCTLFDIY